MSWKKKQKILKHLWNTRYKYDWHKQKNVWKKWYRNNSILWFNEKHIEEELDNKSTIKCHSDLKKHRYELVTESKKQCNRMFIDKK